MLYDDDPPEAHANGDPRKKDKSKPKDTYKLDNNEVYVCLKLNKIRELMEKGKRTTTNKKKTVDDEDEVDEATKELNEELNEELKTKLWTIR